MGKSAQMRLIFGFFAILMGSFALETASAVTTPRIKPPAPGPSFLTKTDHDRLKRVSKSVKAREFSKARKQAATIEDPLAKSLGEWMYFRGEDPRVNLADADNFLDAHNDWPALSRIQAHVEKRIQNNTPSKAVLEFFDQRDPVTGEGKIQLARALFNAGETEAGELHLRDAWVNFNLTNALERTVLANYGGRLRQEDHAARVDRLLWARQVTRARRVFSKLNKKNRRMAETRAVLLLGVNSAPTTYGNLPEDERMDSGVLLAAVRHFRRRGDQQYAISLAAQSPKNPEKLRNSSRWWYERQLLMRWALKNGRFADAYTAASNHGLNVGGNFAEAEFNAGWIALRFLDDPQRAETHFLALASAVGTPISLSRAHYWLGRAAEARDLPQLANAHYEAASKHIYTYHGQLAAEKIGGNALDNRFAPPVNPTALEKSMFSSRSTVAALKMLSDLDLDYEFMVFAYHVDDQLESPGEYIELAKVLNGEGAPHLTVRAGKVAVRRKAFAPEVAYPVIFVPDEAASYVEPAIILGLSRQESEFNARAYSRAGARGVMQLIPSTAQITARKAGLRYSRSALLDDPIYNMTIGSAHLSHLLDRFNGSLIMTFAAYNAGAARVDQWVKTYGDPRDPDVNPLDWVELIPFAETRNYVQRVLENIQVYRGRLNGTPIAGNLYADLTRGGAQTRNAHLTSPSAVLFAAAEKVGTQKLSPVPAPTRERAEEFKSRLANFYSPTPSDVTNQLTPDTDSEAVESHENAATANSPNASKKTNKRRKRNGSRRQNASSTETPSTENKPVENENAVDALSRKLDNVLNDGPDATDANSANSNEQVIEAAAKIVIANDDATPPSPQPEQKPAQQQPEKNEVTASGSSTPRLYRPGERAPNDNEAADLNAGQLDDWIETSTENVGLSADNEIAPTSLAANDNTDGRDAAETQNVNSEAADANLNGPSDDTGCITYQEFVARADALADGAEAANANALAGLAARVGDCQ